MSRTLLTMDNCAIEFSYVPSMLLTKKQIRRRKIEQVIVLLSLPKRHKKTLAFLSILKRERDMVADLHHKKNGTIGY